MKPKLSERELDEITLRDIDRLVGLPIARPWFREVGRDGSGRVFPFNGYLSWQHRWYLGTIDPVTGEGVWPSPTE